jgi:peptidoglycan/LPS O-acetylase OafA/YrhL
MKIGEAIYGFTLSHFDAFAVGGSIALFDFKWLKNNITRVVFLFSIVAAIILFINQYSISGSSLDPGWTSFGIPLANLGNYQHVWSYSLVNVLFFLMIIIIIDKNYRGIFNNSILVSMGKVVYGTYIFHFLILMVFTRVFTSLSFPVLFVLCMASAYATGLLSYKFFEKRFLKFKY